MKRIVITLVSITFAVLALGQAIYKGGDVRLSPRLLNYQGYLTDTLGNPITNPSVSMVFAIFDAASAGNQKWAETQPAVSVSKGIFHVLLGSVAAIPDSVFNNTTRYLQLTVAGQALSPRTRIVSSPYSYTSTYSDTAAYARAAAADNHWTFRISDGADTTLQMGGRWGVTRIGNVLFGNADSTNINLGVACTTGTGIADYKYTTIAGGRYNAVRASGNTISGGESNSTYGYAAVISGGYQNRCNAHYTTVGGGFNNTADGYNATIAGGDSNYATNDYATVCGGSGDTASGYFSSIGGGDHNVASAFYASVGGGRNNRAGGNYSSIPGGYNNNTGALLSTIAGGDSNYTDDWYATVSGGHGDTANGFASVVGGGTRNRSNGNWGTIAGGSSNIANGYWSTIAGGQSNTTDSSYSTIGGGDGNIVRNLYATVGGGQGNTASGQRSLVSGGRSNTASNTYSAVGGGYSNVVSGYAAVVGGGTIDTARAIYGGIGSGIRNVAGDSIIDTAAVVAGGRNNRAISVYCAVGGGIDNMASVDYAVVAGGQNNHAGDYWTAVGGGLYNYASNNYAAVPGGRADTAAGLYSFAANDNSYAGFSNSTALNGQVTTATGQTRIGTLSKAGGTFTIDHPLDPENKILNHYFVESPDMSNMYSGSAVLDARGRAQVELPGYFDALNKDPRVQLTGVGSSDVYVAEDIRDNRFAIGGKPGMKVYWTVIADRKDQSAEIIRNLMPVEQPKTGVLAGRSLDDDFLVVTKGQLEEMGKAGGFKFRHAAEEMRYEDTKKEGK